MANGYSKRFSLTTAERSRESVRNAYNALAETLAELGYPRTLVRVIDATDTAPVVVQISLIPEHAERIAVMLMHGISQGRIHAIRR
jgi:hypothetical protein